MYEFTTKRDSQHVAKQRGTFHAQEWLQVNHHLVKPSAFQ